LEPFGLSRTQVQRLIKEGCICLNAGPFQNPKHAVQEGEVYSLTKPEAKPTEILPQSIDLCIVYEDSDLLVINKPAGMVVHPAPGHYDSTLVNALLAHCGQSLSGIGGVKRPGIVHRLDKDTSGLMVVAKNDATHKALSKQFAAHGGEKELKRVYWALVWGRPHPIRGTIHASMGRHPRHRQKMAVSQGQTAKEAITHYATLETYNIRKGHMGTEHSVSLLECTLATGRTHQIRVHCHYINCPLVGDPIYGKKNPPKNILTCVTDFQRQALHAKNLVFTHPTSGHVCMFEAPLPSDFENLLQALQA
jgi:23S rRNA pseudouridine1911/1915/1917 synthase